jgi:hypothetical protein
MRFSQHFRMSVTRRGEKELRLGAFIARALQGLGVDTQGTDPLRTERAILVIARSAQSPVVKSIGALARDIAGAGCRVRMILARTDGAGLADLVIATHAAALDCEVRRARNPRLIEAHEQLVLGPRAAWTGDSMRRDPATCDAYESFVEDCPEIAATAGSTFERLWRDGEPVSEALPLTAAGALATPKAIGPAIHLARRP